MLLPPTLWLHVQVCRDADFLRRHGVVDYSLLVCFVLTLVLLPCRLGSKGTLLHLLRPNMKKKLRIQMKLKILSSNQCQKRLTK